jgi:hypothetical protein
MVESLRLNPDKSQDTGHSGSMCNKFSQRWGPAGSLSQDLTGSTAVSRQKDAGEGRWSWVLLNMVGCLRGPLSRI